MQEYQPYLIFLLNDSLYGLPALSVQEIFSLPEVTAIAEAPADIIGVINLRGEILPVMDLSLRLGYQPLNYQLTDSIIVVEWENQVRVGIVVNQVYEVKLIVTNAITNGINYGRQEPQDSKKANGNQHGNNNSNHFLTGVAQVDDDLVMLLSSEQLIHYVQKSAVTENAPDLLTASPELFMKMQQARLLTFCADASPEVKEVFHKRAKNLMSISQNQDFTGLIPLAVISLNEEFFGVNLEVVREFTDIYQVTPVPCTPSHIVGNINLRGEIVTLVDVRQILNMSFNRQEMQPHTKAMIIEVGDLVAGIKVDQVHDVMYLNPNEMGIIPTAVHSTHDEYLRGTAPYQQKIMSILDLPKIMTQGGLVVEEEI